MSQIERGALRVAQPPDDGLQRLRDVQVPKKFYQRVRTGESLLDELFGGLDSPGILQGAGHFFTGAPGAGKSTFALQLAERLQLTGLGNVLYNLGEENVYMVKMRADRLKVQAEYLVDSIDEVDELVAVVKRHDIKFLFQDSLQSLRDKNLSGTTKLLSAASKLYGLSRDHEVTTFVVGQCTKGGTFAGPNTILHEFDAHLHLGRENDGVGRTLEFQTKNRFGPSGVQYKMEMTPAGMFFEDPSKPKAGPPTLSDGSKAPGPSSSGADVKAARLAQARSVAKGALLDGQVISAYTLLEMVPGVSGSGLRILLKEVCVELEREGYGISERKVDGRTCSFISRWRVQK